MKACSYSTHAPIIIIPTEIVDLTKQSDCYWCWYYAIPEDNWWIWYSFRFWLYMVRTGQPFPALDVNLELLMIAFLAITCLWWILTCTQRCSKGKTTFTAATLHLNLNKIYTIILASQKNNRCNLLLSAAIEGTVRTNSTNILSCWVSGEADCSSCS